ncbi:MAG TPA: neutral/alkaline non-lysosomal ceramidase N-terminal domain-containing protein [Chloroflexota bacterium]|nr:neutral/alkaline non-lysosomal ceramidase N-terminal domain-containing protein [Chloroflexota bacterium]
MASLRAGVARGDVTPPLGVELCGYGPFLGRASTGVHDPLWCRAIVLESDRERLVLVSCDLIGVLQETTDAVRSALRERLGVPPERVMIACTHTHSGPNTVRLIGWGEPDGPYRAGLAGRITETVLAAAADLRPARLALGRTLIEGIGRNRVQPDGTGLLDPELTVLRVGDEAGRARAVLFHFGAHPVVLGPQNRLISGDWAGDAERRLEEDPDGPTIAGFLNGAAGDINSIVAVSGPSDWDAVAAIGGRVHAAVAALLPTLRDTPMVEIAARTRRVDLPLDEPEWDMVARVLAGYDHSPRTGDRPYYVTGVASERFERDWAETMQARRARPDADRLTVEIQAIRLGSLALVAVPAEVFALYGFAIKQRSPFRMTSLVGFANDAVGYVARPQDFDDPGYGGYAALKAPRILGLPPFARRVGDVLVEACLDLLHGLKE